MKDVSVVQHIFAAWPNTAAMALLFLNMENYLKILITLFMKTLTFLRLDLLDFNTR